MKCGQSFHIWVTVINTCITVSIILLFLFTIYLIFISRRIFHPFFVMFFILFLLSYPICDGCAAVTDIALAANISEDATLLLVADNLSTIFYRLATPLIIFLLLERLYATKNSQIYEKSRPWLLFCPLLPLGLLFSVADDLAMYYELVSGSVEQYSLGALEVIIIILMFFLLHINRRLVRQQTGRGVSLSTRYQISENVRVLRIVIPVVLADGLLLVEYILGEQFFGANRQLDLYLCTHESSYFTWYIVFNILTYLLEVAIPLSIIYGHPVIFDTAKSVFYRRKSASKRKFRITNVFGVEMKQAQTSQEYFKALENHWK